MTVDGEESQLRCQLTERLPSHRGLVIEEKKHSVTIHYRHARDKRRALDAIDGAIRELTDARALASPHAVTVMPHGGPGKGVALQQARRRFARHGDIRMTHDVR